jgi:hypothetical protein
MLTKIASFRALSKAFYKDPRVNFSPHCPGHLESTLNRPPPTRQPVGRALSFSLAALPAS